MQGSEQGERVCMERLPWEGKWTREGAERARDEADAVAALVRTPAWALVAGEWESEIQKQRKVLEKRGQPESAVDTAQREIAAHVLAASIIRDALHDGVSARTALADGKFLAVRSSAKPMDQVNALLAQKRATLALEVAEHPGWQVIVRRLAALAWAAASLKEILPPETAVTLDALIGALEAPIGKLRRELGLGMAAEEWIAAHQAQQQQQ